MEEEDARTRKKTTSGRRTNAGWWCCWCCCCRCRWRWWWVHAWIILGVCSTCLSLFLFIIYYWAANIFYRPLCHSEHKKKTQEWLEEEQERERRIEILNKMKWTNSKTKPKISTQAHEHIRTNLAHWSLLCISLVEHHPFGTWTVKTCDSNTVSYLNSHFLLVRPRRFIYLI